MGMASAIGRRMARSSIPHRWGGREGGRKGCMEGEFCKQ